MIDPASICREVLLDQQAMGGPLGNDDFASLHSFVRHQRLDGYLREAILDGRVQTSEKQSEAVERKLVESMERSVAIEAMVGGVCDTLAAEGVTPVALKGLAACRLDRPRPELRSFFDADLLVRPDDLDRTYSLLTRHGFDRRFAEARPGFDATFGKGTAFVDSDGRELDLHRTLAMGSLGISVEVEGLWEDLIPIEIAGRQIFALSPEARLLHACVHAAASAEPPRWHTLIDIASIDRAGFSVDRTVDLARAWQYDAVVHCALALTRHHLGGVRTARLSELEERTKPTRLQLLTLRAYQNAGTGYASRSLLAIPVIPTLRLRARFIRSLMAPSSGYSSDRYTTRRERWLSALRDFRSLARAPR